MYHCEIHGIDFDMEENGGCPDCMEHWVPPENQDNSESEEA